MRALLLGLLLLSACRTRPFEATADSGDQTPLVFDMAGGVEYRASSVPTNLPRISIEKIDHTFNRCTTVLLVGFTSGMTQPGLTLPEKWFVERAWQVPSVNGCTQLQPPANAVMPTQITGSFMFVSNNPTTLTVHANLMFPTHNDSLDADNLPIK